jgi:UDP-N-acetylglucosamine 2-epimerase (non-hydrolysing)
MAQRSVSRYVAVVVGTRPEIIKLAQVVRLLGSAGRLLHTCQHEDEELSGVFLAAAGLRQAKILSGVCGAPRHVQFARMIEQLGEIFRSDPPAAVIVQGDTNTASAAAQAASYAGVPLIHVEAGLRSYDRAMPEEINRCMVGVLADVHCAPTAAAVANLRAEGVPAAKIELTGNTIVEATLSTLPSQSDAWAIAAELSADPGCYVLATIHRPENTDDPGRLETILAELSKLGLPVLLPMHPRLRQAVARHRLTAALDRLRPIAAVDHRTFLALARLARLLVSDSGGVQEECTVLKRPLIVIRNSSERPEAIEAGFAHLVRPGHMIGDLGRELIADPLLDERLARIPCPFGDGRASGRIASCALAFWSPDGRANRTGPARQPADATSVRLLSVYLGVRIVVGETNARHGAVGEAGVRSSRL